MCAIFGFSGEPTHKAVKRLIEEMVFSAVKYGKDATGWMKFDNKFDYHKKPVDGVSYVFKYGIPKFKNNLVFHTRYATSGNPRNNKNNHPFIGEKYGLVHNGYLYQNYLLYYLNWMEKSECDSEIFLNMIEKLGFKKMYKELIDKGVFSLVLMNKENGDIYIMRNPKQQIYFVDLRKEIGILIWVSRKDVFSNAVKNGFKRFPKYDFKMLKSGIVYKIRDGGIIKKIDLGIKDWSYKSYWNDGLNYLYRY